jgi:hypothetical protein
MVYIQSAKILLLPPIYEIIMVPSNHLNFQYCDSNIGLFFIASCKVNTLNHLFILFCISSMLLFWWLSLLSYHSSKYRNSDSCHSFSLLKAIAKRFNWKNDHFERVPKNILEFLKHFSSRTHPKFYFGTPCISKDASRQEKSPI